MSKDQADLSIVDRIRTGDQRALADFIGSIECRLNNILVLHHPMLQPCERHEVIAMTGEALWSGAAGFDPAAGTLLSYCIGIARNKARCVERRERPHRRPGLPADCAATNGSAPPSPPDASLNGILEITPRRDGIVGAVVESLRRLRGREHRVVRADIEAGGRADTALLAREMGITAANVRVRRHHGWKKFVAYLVETGYAEMGPGGEIAVKFPDGLWVWSPDRRPGPRTNGHKDHEP